MTVLALDPSSTLSGYALLARDERLLEAGLLRPHKATDPAALRIAAMCADWSELLESMAPSVVVIEWTSGKVGRRRHHGGGAGLAVYGVAIGALWRTAETWAAAAGSAVTIIDENTWTAGVPKARRAAEIARLYRQYDPANDGGGDIADAIGLARWYLREKQLEPYIFAKGNA